MDGNEGTEQRRDDQPGDGRDETKEERLDRKWDDLLQELRVMQTGVQLTAGFLLTLPFQQAFADLDDLQRTLYLCLVVLAGLTTAMVLAPVAVHRSLSGRHVKERLVDTAHRITGFVLTAIGFLITGITFFVFSIVTDRATAAAVTTVVALAVVLLLAVLPWRLLSRS
ncbi:DUF6328 family protein [Nocardioides sp.]|uniref:DUF6328 family protein n=1 Tax=Nocardioides sp. TaxID=35761 RepID=UPI0031FE5FEC|nr:hypothetical protein [Nocardioides sp.]